ncbi:uncharacterized protein [Prorops nasuta]|uniref:uncharacterized protein isoform X3 n=1 Tax=Prorops nasuta TaxID=863751 RepID=UPI0034CEBBCC
MTENYYVIIWDQFCSVVPYKWQNLSEKSCMFPVGQINLTKAIQKRLTPGKNWICYKFKKVLGPYASFEIARNAEKTCIDISSSDDLKLNALSSIEMESLPIKRLTKKRKFYDDDYDYGDPESVRKIEMPKSLSLPPSNYQPRIIMNKLYELQQAKKNNVRKPIPLKQNISVFSTNPQVSKAIENTSMLNHKAVDNDSPNETDDCSALRANTDENVCSLLPAQHNITSSFTNSVLSFPKNNNQRLNRISESVRLEQTEENSGQMERPSSISAPAFPPSYQECEEDSNNFNLNEATNDNESIHSLVSEQETGISSNLIVDIRRLHNDFNLFRAELKKSMNTQSKILTEMLALMHDDTRRNDIQTTNDTMGFLLPDFPIQSIEDYIKFEKQLQEDNEIRKLFASKIKRIGGNTIQKVVANILNFAISLEVGHKLTWTGCNGSTKMEGSTFANIIDQYFNKMTLVILQQALVLSNTLKAGSNMQEISYDIDRKNWIGRIAHLIHLEINKIMSFMTMSYYSFFSLVL